jgi:hypothetical protein
MLYIAEGYHLLLSIENPWLKFNTWVQVWHTWVIKFYHIDQCLEVYNFLFSPSITCPIWRIVFWQCNVKHKLLCHWQCQSLLGVFRS